jgi:hydrogenase-1 operon protein HyaE
MTALVMPTPAAEPPLVARLIREGGATRLDEAHVDSFVAGGGATVLFFTEDPMRVRETLDLAVILPEIAKAVPERLRMGVLPPPLANARAAQFNVRRWPALVFLRDGGWLGNIEGLRDWDEYVEATTTLLAASPRPVPKVIPISAPAAPGCGS